MTGETQDKKKKIKEILTKVLVVLLLVAISCATYKVNLSQMLHDFVLRFFHAASYEEPEETPTPSEEPEENGTKDGTDEEEGTEPTEEETAPEGSLIGRFFGGTVASCQELDETEAYVQKWLAQYQELRRLSNLGSLQETDRERFPMLSSRIFTQEQARSQKIEEEYRREGIRVTDVECSISVKERNAADSAWKAKVYEWVSVCYETARGSDVMGYGVWHDVTFDETGLVSHLWAGDLYEEDCVGMTCPSDQERKLQDAEPVGMDGLFTEELRSYLGAAAKGYNASLAVAYADQYALSYNSAYSNYNSIGGDCANFVSQCLHAGGLSMTDGWFWKSYDNRSSSWTYCPSQVKWMSENVGKMIENPTNEQVTAGNPVYYYSKSSDRYSHAAICVGVNSGGVPVVDAHNNDRYRVPWTLGSNWLKRSTVVIGALEEDREPPVLTDVTISNVTANGFQITAKVSDNVGVESVLFPVWSEENGQDDLVWHAAVLNGNVASCYVRISDHGSVGGTYRVNAYAFDRSGNTTGVDGGNVLIRRDSGSTTVKGDVNGDGAFNLLDVSCALSMALGIQGDVYVTSADWDGNGKIDMSDVSLMLKGALGM